MSSSLIEQSQDNKRQRTTHTFIDNGAHGEVYIPPYNCEKDIVEYKNAKKYNEPEHVENTVGKIFQDDQIALKELQFAEIMDKWDLTDGQDLNNYFVMPTKSCKTTDRRMQTKIQLVMPNAGKDLLNLFKSSKGGFDCNIWFKILLNIIKAIKIMHNNGFVHCDVKLENLLFDNKVGRLADFGLARSFEEFKTREFSPYFLTPPEFFAHSNKDYEYQLKSINVSAGYTLYDALRTKGPFVSENTSIYIKDDTVEKYDMGKYDIGKYDIYSLGIACVRIHEYIVFDTPQKKNDYIEFVKKLIASNFNERATIEKALDMCNKLIEPSQTGGGIKKKEAIIKSLQLKIQKLQDKMKQDKITLKEVEKSLKEAKKASKKKRQ